MKDFKELMKFIYKWEGDPGYVNHPDDPGGETKYGIAKTFYPHLDIKNLTKEEATDIYFRDYYQRNNVSKIPDFMQLPYFDCCINQGFNRANKLLQKAINLQADAFNFYPISVDGLVGPITRGMCSRVNSHILILDFIRLRLDHYRRISFREKFLLGWENRMNDLIVHSL